MKIKKCTILLALAGILVFAGCSNQNFTESENPDDNAATTGQNDTGSNDGVTGSIGAPMP